MNNNDEVSSILSRSANETSNGNESKVESPGVNRKARRKAEKVLIAKGFLKKESFSDRIKNFTRKK